MAAPNGATCTGSFRSPEFSWHPRIDRALNVELRSYDLLLKQSWSLFTVSSRSNTKLHPSSPLVLFYFTVLIYFGSLWFESAPPHVAQVGLGIIMWL